VQRPGCAVLAARRQAHPKVVALTAPVQLVVPVTYNMHYAFCTATSDLCYTAAAAAAAAAAAESFIRALHVLECSKARLFTAEIKEV